MYLAWNTYLRLVDVNYNNLFCCPNCTKTPDTIIFDGIALGTLKEIPKDTPPTEQHLTPHVPIQDRVWVSSPRIRTSLRQYAKEGLSPNRYAILIADLDYGSFHDYIVNGSTTILSGEIVTYLPINQHISSILKYLSTTESPYQESFNSQF